MYIRYQVDGRQEFALHPALYLLGMVMCTFNALLSDFQGTFKDLDGYAMESTRYFLPREATSPPNEITDVFALGTLMYTIMVGVEPYPDLSDSEVEDCYRRQEFPETNSIACGRMILRCWSGEYASAEEVVRGLTLLEE